MACLPNHCRMAEGTRSGQKGHDINSFETPQEAVVPTGRETRASADHS